MAFETLSSKPEADIGIRSCDQFKAYLVKSSSCGFSLRVRHCGIRDRFSHLFLRGKKFSVSQRTVFLSYGVHPIYHLDAKCTVNWLRTFAVQKSHYTFNRRN